MVEAGGFEGGRSTDGAVGMVPRGRDARLLSVGALMLVYVVAWAISVYTLSTMSLGR